MFGDLTPLRNQSPAFSYDIAAWILTAGALLLVLPLHLLPGLLAGLVVYELVHLLAPQLKVVRIRQEQGKLAAVALLTLGVVLLLTLAVVGLTAFLRSEVGSLPVLLQKMADILDTWRTDMPPWAVAYVPEDVGEIKTAVAAWLRAHA